MEKYYKNKTPNRLFDLGFYNNKAKLYFILNLFYI